MSIRIQTSDGYQLHAHTRGEVMNPPIILVHGYPDSQVVWSKIAEQLAERFYVITYDVRGAGYSDVPKKVHDYRLDQLAQDLAAVSRQLLGTRPFHLVGHDWGSIQNWESVTTPRLQGQILSFSSLSGPSLDHAAFWMRDRAKDNKRAFFGQLSKSWYIAMFQLPWLPETVWKTFAGKKWHDIVKKMEKNPNIAANPTQLSDGVRGVQLYRANFIERLLYPQPRFAHCPVQAIVLEDDAFVGANLMDDLARWVPDLSVRRVPANHWAILSRPQEISAWIAEFAHKHHKAA